MTPPGAEANSTTTSPAAAGVPEPAQTFFEALGTEDLSRMGAMLEASAGDSPAALYAMHQLAFRRAEGSAFLETTADVGDDNVVLTGIDYDLDGNEIEESAEGVGFGNVAD